MMRKTIVLGLCCAFASPALSEERPITIALGEFCRTTTSLVACKPVDARPDGMTGSAAAPSISVIATFDKPLAQSHIRLAEAKTPPDLQARLQEYICELLGYEDCGAKAASPQVATLAPDDNEAIVVLPATELSEYMKTRESWGTGTAKVVKAPPAKGAPASFIADSETSKTNQKAAPPAETVNEPIIHAAEERPVPQLTDIPRSDIESNLANLLAERESWGRRPAKSTADPGGSKASGRQSSANNGGAAPAAGISKAATVTAPATGDLTAFLKLRESWGMMAARPVKAPLAKGAPASLKNEQNTGPSAGNDRKADTGSNLLGTADLKTYLAQRDTWGTGSASAVKAPLAKGAEARVKLSKATPWPKVNAVEPTVDDRADRNDPALGTVNQSDIVRARNALLKERESWGTEPIASASSVTGDVESYLARRDRWGQGDASKPVKAPLARGARPKIQLATAMPWPQADTAEPTVDDRAERDAPEIAAMDGGKIQKALASLLATRNSWGTEPKLTGVAFAGDLDRYLSRRDTWGQGPTAKKVAAPLAKGAPKKLKLAKALPTPVVNTAVTTPDVERPVPQVADIPRDQVAKALSDLLATRQSWGQKPAASEPSVTGDLAAYLARRDRWGTPGDARAVKAPLAKGAPKKLELATALPAPASDGPVTTPAVERPVPVVGDIPAGKVTNALKQLLAERESWGAEPALSEPAFAGDLTRYLARRDSWGNPGKSRPVKAPLAKGAPKKLKLAKTATASGPSRAASNDPIVHPAENRPAPELEPVAQDKVRAALSAFLATRQGWGTAPSQSAPSRPTAASASPTVPADSGSGTSSSAPLVSGDRERKVAAVGNAPLAAPISKQDCADELRNLTSGRSILFENASAELDQGSSGFLDDIAAIIRRCKDVSVEIGGHTDSLGSAARNKRLSQARAESVLEYLVNAGVSTRRLVAEGYGEAKPVASNATRESRAKNRRIEFKVR